MEKVWKDGRVIVLLNEEEKVMVNETLKLDTPSNKNIMLILKLILDILTS